MQENLLKNNSILAKSSMLTQKTVLFVYLADYIVCDVNWLLAYQSWHPTGERGDEGETDGESQGHHDTGGEPFAQT